MNIIMEALGGEQNSNRVQYPVGTNWCSSCLRLLPFLVVARLLYWELVALG
jgi:hypothetical protein